MPAPSDLKAGAWLWWFWLFFIRDENTAKTGRCRQLMILWSVKLDKQIRCNDLDICVPVSIEPGPKPGQRILNGAAAAWYFDGQKMREPFVLEQSQMILDLDARTLRAPGATPSAFRQVGGDFITSIKTKSISFEFHAKQEDFHPAVGPTYDRTVFPAHLALVEGTRLERMALRGFENGADGKRKKIFGSAYFQKILLAAPPPQWHWGLYHFGDGSLATFMQTSVGAAGLRDNLGLSGISLGGPALVPTRHLLIYHAPSKRVFEANHIDIRAEKKADGNYAHHFISRGPDFTASGRAASYSHACWSFEKNVGVLPVKSLFKYNEYPAVLEELDITPSDGSPVLKLNMGWGNMENAWGFIL